MPAPHNNAPVLVPPPPPPLQVTEGGQYVPPPPDNQKASYATMVYVRATIVRDSGDFLSECRSAALGAACLHWLAALPCAPGP